MGVIEKVVKLLGISGFINIVDKKGELDMCAFDESKYLGRFKNHVATFTDYNNIKILDFKNQKSSDYRIRFLFEEDYKRLHITGDIGDLIACNYNNMCFDEFGDFVNNTSYFERKVACHSEPFRHYDEELAREQVIKHIEEYLDLSDFDAYFEWQSDEENMNDILDSIFDDFTEENGIGAKGLDVLYEVSSNAAYGLYDAGKKDTDILELYMLAFKLAMKQLNEDTKTLLSEEEYEILKGVSDRYKYIARNRDGSLVIHTEPYFVKDYTDEVIHGSEWVLETSRAYIRDSHLFKMIKWEDDKPTLIADLLKEKQHERK